MTAHSSEPSAAACPACDGSGRLYTSGWDGEGFPCPECLDRLSGRLAAVEGCEHGFAYSANCLDCQMASGEAPDA